MYSAFPLDDKKGSGTVDSVCGMWAITVVALDIAIIWAITAHPEDFEYR